MIFLVAVGYLLLGNSSANESDKKQITTQEILKLDKEDWDITEALENLGYDKWEKLNLLTLQTTFVQHPQLTKVERNFMIMMDMLRIYEATGELYRYLVTYGIADHIEIFEEVGLTETANIMRSMLILKKIEKNYRNSVRDKEKVWEFQELVDELEISLLKFFEKEGNHFHLIYYISENKDQFCLRNSAGEFVSIDKDGKEVALVPLTDEEKQKQLDAYELSKKQPEPHWNLNNAVSFAEFNTEFFAQGTKKKPQDSAPPEKIESMNLKINVDLEKLFKLKTAKEVFDYVKATDSSGKPVATIPINKTSARTWFDFSSAAPTCPYTEDVTVAQFVSDVSYALRDHMIPNAGEFNYLHVLDADKVIWKGIEWNPQLKAWYFQCDLKK